MSNNPDIILQRIFEFMDGCVDAIKKGGTIDMQPFDNMTREFCDILEKLAPIEAKKYEGSIGHIIDRLNIMIPKIEASKDELEARINSLNQHNKAYNAYGNAMFLALQSANNEE